MTVPPPSTPNFAIKYKPKRSLDDEIKHQTKMLKEAKAELKKAKEGTKCWRAKKIRCAIVKRFLFLAHEKKDSLIKIKPQQVEAK